MCCWQDGYSHAYSAMPCAADCSPVTARKAWPDRLKTIMAALLIFATTILVSLVGFSARGGIEGDLFRPYWFLPKRQYWTLITSGFVHADISHLLLNGLTYWFFAFPLQRAIGPDTFPPLYFIGLILSNPRTYFKHRREPEYACLGASGAILAVLFAAIVYYPRSSLYML